MLATLDLLGALQIPGKAISGGYKP